MHLIVYLISAFALIRYSLFSNEFSYDDFRKSNDAYCFI